MMNNEITKTDFANNYIMNRLTDFKQELMAHPDNSAVSQKIADKMYNLPAKVCHAYGIEEDHATDFINDLVDTMNRDFVDVGFEYESFINRTPDPFNERIGMNAIANSNLSGMAKKRIDREAPFTKTGWVTDKDNFDQSPAKFIPVSAKTLLYAINGALDVA